MITRKVWNFQEISIYKCHFDLVKTKHGPKCNLAFLNGLSVRDSSYMTILHELLLPVVIPTWPFHTFRTELWWIICIKQQMVITLMKIHCHWAPVNYGFCKTNLSVCSGGKWVWDCHPPLKFDLPFPVEIFDRDDLFGRVQVKRFPSCSYIMWASNPLHALHKKVAEEIRW